MTPAQALSEAKRLALQGKILVRGHGRQRSGERNVGSHDLRQAILSATRATHGKENNTWNILGGKDLDGDALEVVLALDDDGARLVTVM